MPTGPALDADRSSVHGEQRAENGLGAELAQGEADGQDAVGIGELGAVVRARGLAARCPGRVWRCRSCRRLGRRPARFLHPDDAVANKVTTLFGRAAPRDYLDLNAVLASGRYSGEWLLQLASEHDAGVDPRYFA
ncbi:MAG: hypothetical protein HOY79_45470 [Streptomyces sp.]|nr:hypothetical protein [Streptomyces sp.]